MLKKIILIFSVIIFCIIGFVFSDNSKIDFDKILEKSELKEKKFNKMPKEINLLRLGEVVLLGTDTAVGSKFTELYDDAFILKGQLVEIQTKPSMPIGTRSVNAFGEVVQYEDKGQMLRGIVAVGRQDVDLDGIYPLDSAVQVIGGSSDHLILDLTCASHYKVGDVVEFKLSYGALLSAFTSKYINKKYEHKN